MRNLSAGHQTYVGCGLEMFTAYDLEAIHSGTLEVMERTGIKIDSPKARSLFEQAGARVDREREIVRIPAYMVNEAIRTAPGKILLAGRDRKNDVILENGRVNFTPFGVGVNVIDLYTGQCRPSTKKDVEDATRLTDALDQIDLAFATLTPRDVNPWSSEFHAFEATISNTTKNCPAPCEDGRYAELGLEMAGIVVGGKDKLKDNPIVVGGGCPLSPLSFSEGLAESLMVYAQHEVPFNCLSMAMAGGTGPVTLAGTLITHNAEVLTGVVLSQLVKKGAPVIYGSSTTNLDLRKATATVGSPELALINAAVAKLAQFYNLPSFVAGG